MSRLLKTVPVLTPRQRQVAQAACTGKPYKILGFDLGLAESTVKFYMHNIMRKLGVGNRAELAALITEERVRAEFAAKATEIHETFPVTLDPPEIEKRPR